MSQKGWKTNTNNPPPAPSISLSSQASVNYHHNPHQQQQQQHLQSQPPATSLVTSRSPHLGFLPFGFDVGGDSFVNPPLAYSPRQQMRNEAGMALVFSVGGQVLNIGFEKAVEFLGGFGEQLFARTSVSLESLIHYEDLPGILQVLMVLNHGSRDLVVRMVTDFGRYQWMSLRLSMMSFPAANGQEECVVATCHRREGPEQALNCEDELRASAFSAHLNFSSEFVFVSPASLHILGIPPSSLLGFRVQDFIPEEDYAFYESRWSEAHSRGSPNVLFNIMFRTPSGFFPVTVTFFFPRDQAHFTCLCTIGLNTFVQPPTPVPAAGFVAQKQTSLDSALPDSLSQGEMIFPELPALTNPAFENPPKTISPLMTISGGSSSTSSSSIDLLSSQPMSMISPAALPTPPPSSLSSSSSTSISASSSSPSLPLASRSSPTPAQPSAKGGKAKAPPRSTAAHHQPKQPIRKPSITEFSSSSSSSPSSDNDPTVKADPNLKLILKRPETKRPEPGDDGAIRKKKKKKSIYRRSKRTDNHCEFCGKTESPEWRRGPSGSNSLCNACGIKYSKKGLPASGFVGRRHSFGPGASSPGEGSSSSLILDSRRTLSAGLLENENPQEGNKETPE